MRARNIKPGICDNEVLGTADPLLTLLFERLWMMADREGRLEDRPLRIKAQAFPYRDGLSIEPMLDWLQANEFILRYEFGAARFIQVLNFSKHQKPHKNEQASTIPAPSGNPRKSVETIKEVTRHNQGSAMDALIPDSGLLIPDSHTPHVTQKISESSQSEQHAAFERVHAAYPSFPGRQNWIQVELHCKNRIAEGVTWQQLEQGAKRYAAFIAATGQHVLSPVNFFSAVDEPWKQPWEIPAPKPQQNKFAKPAPGEIVQHGDRERGDLEKLMARREAIGIAGFRDPLPKETASQYRLAQDAEWTRRKAASALPAVAAAGGAT